MPKSKKIDKIKIYKISGKGLILVNTEQKVEQIAIEDIIPNRFQPRLAFDEEGLKELSNSIKQHGIIQPLVLRKLGNKYEIIAGERRYKASQMAGLKKVPAIVSNIDDNKSAEIALVENIQRRNLTSIEEAKSYKNLLDRGYMTQEQLAEKMGVSQSTIANKLRLLNLAPEVQDALLEEKISERHARSLLAIPKEEQNEWLKKIINKRMTVRQLDMEIKKYKDGGEQDQSGNANILEPNVEEIMQNAVDITPPTNIIENIIPEAVPQENDNNEESGGATITPNKFFNFLEDEADNMNMEIKEQPELSLDTLNKEPETIDTIEVLEDFDTPPIVEESKIGEILNSEPQKETTDPIFPFFLNKEQSSIEPNNKIEEITSRNSEPIIDPIDSVIKLDPEYEAKQKEEQHMDLKTAINDVRDFVKNLEERGFTINLEEVDLENTYQININIQK